ncbi:MAG: hypothetical protein KIT22_14860 [Verrucomicrobiae bacterium]|nr:hypothetical protein [Verrucomicrobiae bacterium]
MKPHFQRLFAIAWLTVKAALRLRVVLALAAVLLVCVVLLPFFIKHNGTARMFTQVLLTYSLYLCVGLLGIASLWISCGTHATDVDPGQLQLLAVKPAARWQIWLGRWLGIMTLNAALLALAGGIAYGMLQWQSRQLPVDQQQLLAREVLVARGSVREPAMDLEADVEKVFTRRQQEENLTELDPAMVRREIRDQLRARQETVAPNYRRMWEMDLGAQRTRLAGQPLHLRVKLHTASLKSDASYQTVWVIGNVESGRFARIPKQLTSRAFHEFVIPPDLIGPNGNLHIECENRDPNTLLFPLEDGLEVLFPEGGFAGNYVRALLVVLCWLALLTTLGLAAASFLSFIIAALLAMTLLMGALSGNTFGGVLEDGTLLGVDHEAGVAHSRALDRVALPVYRLLHGFTQMLQAVSPIERLSEGRTITWAQLADAVARIVLMAGGLTAATGIFIFNRRELACEQVTA